MKVVKSMNTMRADVMVNPTAIANADHTVFVSGPGNVVIEASNDYYGQAAPTPALAALSNNLPSISSKLLKDDLAKVVEARNFLDPL